LDKGKKRSPKEATPGFYWDFRKQPETNTLIISYYIFRLFARPEEDLSNMIPLSCYGKFSAVGVVKFFVSAEVAGGDSATAVMRVVALRSAKPTERPKKDTARQKRVRKLIVRPRIDAVWD